MPQTPNETALDRQIRSVIDWNERTALIGCGLVDRFSNSRSAEDLVETIDFIRLGIRDAQSHLAIYRDRDSRRSPHFAGRIRRKPSLGRQLDAHVGALKVRTRAYHDRRRILRQIADAVVWILLDMDIRRIAPLYRDGTHELPSDVGLAGVVQLQTDLNESGHFLAMETDLCRCCGVGDLLVVRADGRPITPLPIEVKTHAESPELRPGDEVEILTLTTATDRPLDQQTLELLTTTIGNELDGELVVSARAERQAEEIRDRVELISGMLNSGATTVEAPSRNWEVLRSVILRAQQAGSSFDLAEPGVFYFASKVEPGFDLRTEMQETKRRVRELLGGEIAAGASIQLHTEDQISGFIPPIALWDLPIQMRADLLSNRMIAGTLMDRDLYQTLFKKKGINLEEREGRWRFCTEDGREGGVGPVHLSAIRIGAVIGALSPRSVVEVLAAPLLVGD